MIYIGFTTSSLLEIKDAKQLTIILIGFSFNKVVVEESQGDNGKTHLEFEKPLILPNDTNTIKIQGEKNILLVNINKIKLLTIKNKILLIELDPAFGLGQ